jgi:type VI secretion system FHA domain protein
MSMSFDREGGSIGRLPEPENKFHLPDPDKYISRKHAVISYRNGFYYLKDNSTAGTFFTDKNLKVHRDSIRLTDGARLRIGDYELIVAIPASEMFDAQPSPATTREDDSWFDNFSWDRGEKDDAGIEGNDAESKPFTWGQNNTPHPGPEPNQSIKPIPGSPQAESISRSNKLPANSSQEMPPEDFDISELFNETDEMVATPSVAETPENNRPRRQHRPKPNKEEFDKPRLRSFDADDDLLNVFLEAAGVGDTDFLSTEKHPELMRTVGALFRELIVGLMNILKGRAEEKAGIRVPMTVLRPTENNPLKFSPGIDEALRLLLGENHTGFIDPVEAVREGYQDLQNHQLAIKAGVQASFMDVLTKFDPQQFERKYQEGIVIQRRAKCWDTYSRAYQKIVKEAMDDFFGEAFSRAYEDQLLKLRTKRTKG